MDIGVKDSGIYMILNHENGKYYIGSAKRLRHRRNTHAHDLKGDKHGNRHLQNAWNLYGEASFEFRILEICSKDKLIAKEQWWIDWLDACNPNKGYNMLPIAFSLLGYKHSEETKKKNGDARRGKKQSPEWIENRIAPLRGKKQTEAAIANMKKAKLNQSDETKRLIGLKHKGKIISESHKKAVSEAAKLLQIKRKADKEANMLLDNSKEIKWLKRPE